MIVKKTLYEGVREGDKEEIKWHRDKLQEV